MRIDGVPINPTARELPKDFIETGVTAIDLMNSLVRGQKLPLFSAGGMPHDRIASDIAQNARLRRTGEAGFAIVFVGIGISHDTAETFRCAMQNSGALAHTAMFLNLASESSTQRLLTPRFALTAAEYLAAEEGRHVLVIMTDMTNYCEALREVSPATARCPAGRDIPAICISTWPLSTSVPAASAAPGARSHNCRSLPCRLKTSAIRSPISPATSPRARWCSIMASITRASSLRSMCCPACHA
jgi:V/A-type H+-transporting ATPase subunit B